MEAAALIIGLPISSSPFSTQTYKRKTLYPISLHHPPHLRTCSAPSSSSWGPFNRPRNGNDLFAVACLPSSPNQPSIPKTRLYVSGQFSLYLSFFFFLKFLNNMHQFLCLCVCVFNLLVYQIVMRFLFRSVDLNFFLVFNQIDRMSPGLFWCSALTLLVLFLNFLIICMNFCFVFWVNYILMWVLFGSLVSVPFLGFNPFNFIFVGIFCSAFTLCSFFLFCF